MLAGMEIAPSQALHKTQLPSTIPQLLMRMEEELKCSICLDQFTEPDITHCGHVFCRICISTAISNNPLCPLCKSNCSKRMTRPCATTKRLVEHFKSLEKALSNLDSKPAKRTSKGKIVERKSAEPSPMKSLPQKRKGQKWECSPETSQSKLAANDPSYAASLRSINDRIMSEVGRIDKELEHLDKGSGETTCFNTQTQLLLDDLELPSSPVISPTPPDVFSSPMRAKTYVPEKTIVVTTTMLGSEEKSKVRQWAEITGSIYVSAYSPAVTHIIAKTTDPSTKLAIRSMKTMQAVIDGCWLLPLSWIESGLMNNGIVKEEPFELEGDQYSDDEGPRRSRLSHLNNELNLFDGFQIYLFGTFGKPTKEDLSALITSAGGTVVPTINDLAKCDSHNSNTFVVADPNEQFDLEKDQGIIQKFPFVQTEWIYSSISVFNILDFKPFNFL